MFVSNVLEKQADSQATAVGPSVQVAYKDGQPTPAAMAFAKKNGFAVQELGRTTTEKGEYVVATSSVRGRSAVEVIGDELPKEIAAIYWAKNMYWRAGKPERFVRPVEWLLCLLGEEVVPVAFGGRAGHSWTYGHRQLSSGEPMQIVVPESYAAQLEGEYVLVDAEARRQRIRKGLDRVMRTVPGARWREDEALVDAVTHLTEWPDVLLGRFGEEFLELPEEVLVTVMRDHQKYFAVEDKAGKLLPYFLTVVNTELNEGNAAIIRQGNERVLRARFNDARFFWQVDRRISLIDRASALEKVTFHKDLGSYAAKTARVLPLAERLADAVVKAGVAVDRPALEEAVMLAKSDLTTELVKEFTELQGMIGGLYAQREGKAEIVWQAVYDQYLPASPEDRVPRSVEGALLGIADRADTLAGLFALGLEPTGSKDPFALRRAANAVVKILAEVELPLTIDEVLRHAADTEATATRLRLIFAERLSFYLREVRGFAYDVVTAVLVAEATDVRNAVARAEAVSAMRGSPDFLAVSAAFKRMKNILEQAETRGESFGGGEAAASEVPEQRELARTAGELQGRVQALVAERRYGEALEGYGGAAAGGGCVLRQSDGDGPRPGGTVRTAASAGDDSADLFGYCGFFRDCDGGVARKCCGAPAEYRGLFAAARCASGRDDRWGWVEMIGLGRVESGAMAAGATRSGSAWSPVTTSGHLAFVRRAVGAGRFAGWLLCWIRSRSGIFCCRTASLWRR